VRRRVLQRGLFSQVHAWMPFVAQRLMWQRLQHRNGPIALSFGLGCAGKLGLL
jgi:hypothetical protein